MLLVFLLSIVNAGVFIEDIKDNVDVPFIPQTMLHITACNPNFKYMQLCPGGQKCLTNDKLECMRHIFNVEYCLCPNHDPSSGPARCDPNAKKLQICPGGTPCSKDLNCDEYGCDCPVYNFGHSQHIYSQHIHPSYVRSPSSDQLKQPETSSVTQIESPPTDKESDQESDYKPVHCNPHTNPKQICQNGTPCDPKNENSEHGLHCKYSQNGLKIEYCVCPNPNKVVSNAHRNVHQSVRCDPKAEIQQICPNGEICSEEKLSCNTDYGYGYCLCPEEKKKEISIHPPSDKHHQHHCNPYSNHLCPHTLAECNPDVLDCVEKDLVLLYCICPDREAAAMQVITRKDFKREVSYCHPNAPFLQICPTGVLCIEKDLVCHASEHGKREEKICMCPTHRKFSEIHCNPNSEVTQKCPNNGGTCSKKNLDCVYNDQDTLLYCICPDQSQLLRQSTSQEPVSIRKPILLESEEKSIEAQPLNTQPLNTQPLKEIRFTKKDYKHSIIIEVHCNPYLSQICPGGTSCTEDLDCVYDQVGENKVVNFCICPNIIFV